MRNVHMLGVSALALAIASPVFAQVKPAPDNNAIEEVVVTATKREQTLQDVPISVAVTGQKTIERAQIRDLIDLQSVVPSLKVSQFNAASQTNFVIRGFGNGNGNDGIESSVGVFIDGVYRSRSAAALDDLPEVERIEVLRGPQSTLFGKNVSAGAISIVTKKPQFDFGGKAEVSLGNYDTAPGQGHVTGPLSDTVAVRLSGSVNKRDGYATNVTTGNDVNDRDRWSIRGDLLWAPTDQTSVRVIADYNKITEVCCAVNSIYNGPATQFIGAPAPFGLGKPVGDPAKIFDRDVVFNTDPSNRLTGKGVSGQIDHDLGFAKLTVDHRLSRTDQRLVPGRRLHRRRPGQQGRRQHHQDLHPGTAPGLERRRPVQLADRRLLPGRKARYRPDDQLRLRHPRLCRGPERPGPGGLLGALPAASARP
jgi:iron complex outermembrane receptor protein